MLTADFFFFSILAKTGQLQPLVTDHDNGYLTVFTSYRIIHVGDEMTHLCLLPGSFQGSSIKRFWKWVKKNTHKKTTLKELLCFVS